jgi:hypothetical protein
LQGSFYHPRHYQDSTHCYQKGQQVNRSKMLERRSKGISSSIVGKSSFYRASCAFIRHRCVRFKSPTFPMSFHCDLVGGIDHGPGSNQPVHHLRTAAFTRNNKRSLPVLQCRACQKVNFVSLGCRSAAARRLPGFKTQWLYISTQPGESSGEGPTAGLLC